MGCTGARWGRCGRTDIRCERQCGGTGYLFTWLSRRGRLEDRERRPDLAADQRYGIPIGSIGAIAVAPSDPKIVYVGTGEPDIRSQHSYGIGMFKSTDAGKTWRPIGLEATRQIGRIVVDPRDPNKLYVAALGHVYRGNAERGVYRSTDGGAHWTKVLASKEDPENVGAVDLAMDPQQPETVYASLWADAASAVVGVCAFKYAGAAACISPPIAARTGPSWVAGCRRTTSSARSELQWRRAIPSAVGGGRRPRRGDCASSARAGGCAKVRASSQAAGRGPIGPTTPVRPGPGVNDEQAAVGARLVLRVGNVDPKNPDKIYVINTGTFESDDAGKTFFPDQGSAGVTTTTRCG